MLNLVENLPSWHTIADNDKQRQAGNTNLDAIIKPNSLETTLSTVVPSYYI